MKLANNLEAEYNQLNNALLQNIGAGDPTPGAATKYGLVWFDTGAAKEVKVWDGAAVQILSNRLQAVTGVGAISVGAMTAKSQAISIAAATAGVVGTMSTADFSKLAAATAVNTVSTIVMRDASGNFVAGTITAALTGTASNAALLGNQNSAWHVARANHSGTQLAATISDFSTAADARITAAGLAHLAGTETFTGDKTFSGNVSGITKTHVGLSNVDNTIDLLKPLSTAAINESAIAKARANHTGTQLHTTISDFDAGVVTNPLNTMAVPIASVAMNNQKITGLAEPASPGDAATKNYVDGVASGLDVKASVRAATLANVVCTYTAAGGTSGRGQYTLCPNILDGVTLAAGNRLLLKNMTDPKQNGIVVVTTLGTGANGVWDRATDFDTDAEVTAGSFTFISEGTQQSSGWVMTTDNPIIIGGASGSNIVWAQFSGAGTYTAGNGLSLAGGVFSVGGTTNRITSSGTTVDIAATYVGQASISTVGVVTAGVWNGTDVAVASGGTGASDVAGAKTNLGFMTRFAVNIGDGANGGVAANGVVTLFTITHPMNTLDVQVEIQEIATGIVVYANVIKATTTTLTVGFSVAPATGSTYRCIVLG